MDNTLKLAPQNALVSLPSKPNTALSDAADLQKTNSPAVNSVSVPAFTSSAKPHSLFKRSLSIFFILTLLLFSLYPIIYNIALISDSFSDDDILNLFTKLIFPQSNTASKTDEVPLSGTKRNDYSHPPLSHRLHTYDPPSNDSSYELDLSELYSYTLAEIPKNHLPIRATDLSVSEKYGLSASNETDYNLDLLSFAEASLELPSLSEISRIYGENAPVVLILHTHGTESYADGDAFCYDTNDNCRTEDTQKNVVAVGAVISEYLNSHGITTIHCTEMFDLTSYSDAYSYSEAAIREYTAIYPSIQYIFDVHRDSLVTADSTKLRPVTIADGRLTAQYMCVVGTDEKAGTHTYWRDNLTFACHLQKALNSRTSTLTRRMSIRSASYNQKYAKGSLLLEIGSCGNTLEEAKSCALIVAEEIARIIIEG